MGRPKGKAPELKHDRVRKLILRKIESGVFPPGKPLPPDTVLPGMFKVSRQTVLHALGDLAKEGRIVRRRGSGSFVTDQRHPPLFPGRQVHLGVLWPHEVGPQFLHDRLHGAMTRGILAAWGLDIAAAEWKVPGPYQDTSFHLSQPVRGLRVTCLGQGVRSRTRHPSLASIRGAGFDGVIALSIIEEDWLREVLDLRIPAVLADFASEHLRLMADEVYLDPLPGIRAAVEHFVARGARRIHFVGCYLSVPASSPETRVEDWIASQAGRQRVDPDSGLRLAALRLALDAFGLPLREEQIHYEWFDAKRCRELALRLAALPAEQRPEAVVCHAVEQAEAMIAAFRELGLRLEGAGFTGRAHEGSARAIWANGEEMGAAAAELLISRLQRPRRPAFRVAVPAVFENEGKATEPAPRHETAAP